MSADSKSSTCVFGSKRNGTCILPERSTNASRLGLPFPTLCSRYGSSSVQSASRAMRQNGDASKLQSSSGCAGAFEASTRTPCTGRHAAAIAFGSAPAAPPSARRRSGGAPVPYCAKRYAMMSFDSYIAVSVLGSTRYGNCALPPFVRTKSRNRVPPFGHGCTSASRSSAVSASRTFRQYGHASNS